MKRSALAIAMLLAGCQAQAAIGVGCTRPSDCASPLTCALGRCRPQCADARDCPLGARCIGGNTLAPVCTLDTENHCDAHVCPAPLMCVNDQCRTTCEDPVECVLGPCSSGTCSEPTNDGADAGGSDASVIPAPCSIMVLGTQRVTGPISSREVGIATSRDATNGFVHVGFVAGTTGATTLVIQTSPAGLAPLHAPVDLTSAVFFAEGATSIAVRDNRGDEHAPARSHVVDIIAAFDHRGSEPSGLTVGAIGVMQPGAVPFGTPGAPIVQENVWLCSLDGATDCADPGTHPHPRPSRMLVVGGAFDVPTRFVQRADIGDGLTLRSYAEDFLGDDYITSAAASYLSGDDIDFGSSAGRLIALPGPSGAIAIWNVLSNDPPQMFDEPTAQGRVAVAAQSADDYVLGFAASDGSIQLRTTHCSDAATASCAALAGQAQATPSGTSYVLPALAELPNGGDVALAYVAHTPGQPDRVWLELLSSSLRRRTSMPVLLFTADDPNNAVIDLQIATVVDGAQVTFDVAVLVGAPGASQQLAIAAAAALPSCY